MPRIIMNTVWNASRGCTVSLYLIQENGKRRDQNSKIDEKCSETDIWFMLASVRRGGKYPQDIVAACYVLCTPASVSVYNSVQHRLCSGTTS